MSNVIPVGFMCTELADQGIWHDPPAIGVIIRKRMGFNSTMLENVIELQFLEEEPETNDDLEDAMCDSDCNLTPGDARKLAILLMKSADKAEALGQQKKISVKKKAKPGFDVT